MSSEIAIELSGLSKSYQIYAKPSDRLKQMLMRGHRQYFKEFWAVKDVSLQIRKGETVGIIGRNGSGKSTLLQMICGTLNPTEGQLTVNGRIAALLELGAGFNPEFTGVENVYMAASLYGLTREDVNARFDDIARFADIGEHIDQPVKTYSSGMYVRLAFAVIAHVDADILVIDEALAVGDALFTQKCMRFLRGFMDRGTVLFVSHDTGAIINLCDSVVWLERGHMKDQGDPKRISEEYLASLYAGDSSPREPRARKTAAAATSSAPVVPLAKDPRWEAINASTLRNDLKVFSFDLDTVNGFGHGAANIQEVRLLDEAGNELIQCTGGEAVELRITIAAHDALHRPIVGFSFKDRLGQVLFGDNTYLTYESDPITVDAGTSFVARFRFQMPILPQGDYSIATAIATGTQIDHRQEHWIHDALIVRSMSSSVSTGLVGIPMQFIRIDTDGRP